MHIFASTEKDNTFV